MKREKKSRRTPRITIVDFEGQRKVIQLPEGDTAHINFDAEVSLNGQVLKSRAFVDVEWV